MQLAPTLPIEQTEEYRQALRTNYTSAFWRGVVVDYEHAKARVLEFRAKLESLPYGEEWVAAQRMAGFYEMRHDTLRSVLRAAEIFEMIPKGSATLHDLPEHAQSAEA